MLRNLLFVALAIGGIASAGLETEPDSAADAPPDDEQSADVGYAAARLELAEARLDQIERANRRVRGAYPGTMVAELQASVADARQDLEEIRQRGTMSGFDSQLRAAEAQAKTDQLRWQRAVDANRRKAGAVDSSELEILRLEADLSQAALRRGRGVADGAAEAKFEWQVTQLRDEVERLRSEVARAASGGGVRYWFIVP